MAVIVTILKIMGMVLLVLLGILLLLLGMVLFVPVVYSIRIEAQIKSNVYVSIYWLFHFLRFDFIYEEGKKKSVFRLAGIRLRRKERKTKKAEGERKIKKEGTEKTEKNCTQDNLVSDTVQPIRKKTDKTKLTFPRKKRIRKREGFKNILQSLQNVTIRIGENYQKWRKTDMIQYKDGCLVFGKELKRLFLHCTPKKIKGNLSYSMGNPAQTGQILGIISLMPVVYTSSLTIVPDFEGEIFFVRGQVLARGKIYGVCLLYSILRLIWNKSSQKIIKKVLDL